MTDEDGHRVKRFKHQSYAQSLKDVHLPTATQQAYADRHFNDDESSFYQALEHWRQLNLAQSFLRFADRVAPLSASLPLLVHHWNEIVELWTAALNASDDEGLKVLLDLLQKLAYDLRLSLSPAYESLLSTLLALLSRPISAASLTALLSTFSSLFKYLLIPSNTTELLSKTWESIHETLPKCLPEVQRAMAEVWGANLRRLKPEMRDKAVELMVESLEGLEDPIAWVFVHACKSVSQTLHTSTIPILNPLVACYLSCSNSESVHSLLRRVLTALIHHVKSADQFSSLGDNLIQRLTSLNLSATDTEQQERVRRVLELVAIPCSVRQGSRLTAKQISTLVNTLVNPSLPLHVEKYHTALLKFAVSLLTVSEGDLAMWAGSGVKFLERVWSLATEDVTRAASLTDSNANADTGNGHAWVFALRLSGSLAELGWGGWKVVGVPLTIKATNRATNGDWSSQAGKKRRALLLGYLASMKRLKRIGASETDMVWRKRIESLAAGRLDEIAASLTPEGSIASEDGPKTWLDDETAAEANNIFELSPFFTPAFSAVLARTIDTILQAVADHPSITQDRNVAWLVGACMKALGKRGLQGIGDNAESDINRWVKECVEHWGSRSVEVLEGSIELLQADTKPKASAKGKEKDTSSRQPSSGTLQLRFDSLYEDLKPALVSHNQALRLNCLRLLSLSAHSGSEFNGDSASDDAVRDVIRKCLQGEEVALDVQGVRERVLRISRLPQGIPEKNSVAAEIGIRWLLGQLKVNLRPVWAPTASAIAEIGQRFGDSVWELVFHDVRTFEEGFEEGEYQKNEASSVDSEQEGQSTIDPWENERSWRDPGAHKIRSTLSVWLEDGLGHSKAEFLKLHPSDRFDPNSYYFQLLATLGECVSLAEKHNRDLVPFFLSISSPGDDGSVSKLSKQRLSAWLTLFSKFTNPKGIRSAEQLHQLYVTLLSHPERNLQSLALSCLLTYKSPSLLACKDNIRVLLDDTRWRDVLTAFEFDEIEGKHRAEVVDVVIRLLFGLMLEKKARGSRGNADRRAAILSALGRCTDDELGILVNLMIKPLVLRDGAEANEQPRTFALRKFDVSVTDKQKMGFLTLLGDVIKSLASRLKPYWAVLLELVLNIISDAQSRITSAGAGEGSQDDEADELEGLEAEKEAEAAGSNPTRHIRNLRQVGLKRLGDLFKCPVMFDYAPYISGAFSAIISPRLPSLDKENTQAPSALLELFHVWTLEPQYVSFLVNYDEVLLPKVFDCLVATNVKPPVILRIFDIVEALLEFSKTDSEISSRIVRPHVTHLLSNLATLVQRNKEAAAVSTPIGQRQIRILSEVAQYSTDGAQASTLLTLFIPWLRKPAKTVSEKIKTDLLKIISSLLALIPDLKDESTTIYRKTYDILSSLFQSIRFRSARLGLVAAFHQFATIDTGKADLAVLLDDLNAYSKTRVDEPDFDRRLRAFVNLNETLYQTLAPSDWLPILYNMLQFIQDPEELAIRNNASLCLKHFVDFVSAGTSPEYEAIFLRVLLPGLKNGLHSKIELARSEILSVIAHGVAKCSNINTLQEMHPLLGAGDEEVNFFNNIIHIQLHRRSRALKRLAEFCDDGHLRSSTIADIFVPLVSHYISSSIDHHLANDAIQTTGRMARQLNWGSYYALVQKYIKLSKMKDQSERVYIRTLVAVLDNFHFPMEDEVTPQLQQPEGQEGEQEDADEEAVATAVTTQKTSARVADLVHAKLLPELLSHLEKHDAETDDTNRIPISIGIVKVAQHLPPTTRDTQITRLLTILSQILRSRSQDTRDLVRDTLNRISVTLGSQYLPIVLRELRGALVRGPQLHVLAYVTHALLVHVTEPGHVEAFDNLDGCVGDVAHIAAEVIFGESGKDVQNDDFKTKMREVRGSAAKGLDSFAIVAKHISPSKISSLLAPLRAIMRETESIKVMNLVDEVLKRIAGGLNSNKLLVPTELIVLCHTLISQNAQFLQQAPSKRKGKAKRDAIVDLKRKAVDTTDHYANNSFRFVTFGLDLLHVALRRNRFDFHDANTMARLDSMIVVVGNTLYSTNGAVISLGLKCVAGLVKCPLKSIAKSTPVFVYQILEIIKQIGNTESDIVQTALKTLSTTLREGPQVPIKEKELVYLLELLTPDIEEPARQAAVFTMLRAIIARKFIVPEIYDIMEKVAEIMVTSQSPQVQELCRGVLLQFLLDYPQGKGRLRNQMTFLAKNLSYVYESGRISVMELLGAIISKFQTDLILEYADLVFVALVMGIANDDSSKCREMAAALIRALFGRLDEERRRLMMSHLHMWALRDGQPRLARVSAQVVGFIVDELQAEFSSYLPTALEDLKSALQQSSQKLATQEEERQAEETGMDVDVEWQLPYHVLSVLFKILRVFPELCADEGRFGVWHLVVDHLLFPHAWVRTAACRLLGALFVAVPAASPRSGSGSSARLGLPGDHPLSEEGMRETADKLCLQLKSPHLDDALGLQVVKNLFYIGKCFSAVVSSGEAEEDSEESDDEDEEEDTPKEPSGDRSSNPLPWLFSRLSFQVKAAYIARRRRTAIPDDNWTIQPLSCLRWFAAMASYMDAGKLERFLVHILKPIYRIIEDDTIRDPQMAELKTTATELQDLVRSKVGTTKFSAVYNDIRQQALGVRRERKTARALQATKNPEAAAKRKMQRNVIKKESRKRKERGFVEAKGKHKRRRQE
ncbi:hypothetical protein AX16_009953 [Volvariella volvacea WC 439]|nr:hypothetical protein AX16_009953 [Volvariella volvacea WC 439]